MLQLANTVKQWLRLTHLEGDVTPMKVASLLACSPKDLPGLMLKKVGDAVSMNEPITRSKSVFCMMKIEEKAARPGINQTEGLLRDQQLGRMLRREEKAK